MENSEGEGEGGFWIGMQCFWFCMDCKKALFFFPKL